MIDDEVDEILEHFGVKGMRWGVRNRRSSDGTKKGFSDKQKRNIKIGLAGAAVVGTAVAAVILANNSGRSLSSLRGPAMRVGSAAAKNVVNNVGSTKASSVPRPTRKSVLPEADRKWIEEFSKRQTQINRSANEDLRRRDNDLNVPVYMRTYLPDWSTS